MGVKTKKKIILIIIGVITKLIKTPQFLQNLLRGSSNLGNTNAKKKKRNEKLAPIILIFPPLNRKFQKEITKVIRPKVIPNERFEGKLLCGFFIFLIKN
tara:strand:+ start:269 stop:565 length:297 start_codon:yes stop_codon:yes gene_type:complete